MKNLITTAIFFFVIFLFSNTVRAECNGSISIYVPSKEYNTIEEAINKIKMAYPKQLIQNKEVYTKAIINVSSDYVEKNEINIDRDCLEIIGQTNGDKKPTIIREDFSGDHPAVVSIEGNDIKLENFNVQGKDFVKSDKEKCNVDIFGILALNEETQKENGFKNIKILKNTVYKIGHENNCGDAHGIVVWGEKQTPIEDVWVVGNTATNLRLGSSEAVTIKNNVKNFHVNDNTIFNVNNIGIDIVGFEENSKDKPTVGEIVGNVISDLQEGNAAYPEVAGVYIDGGTGTDFDAGKILIEKNTIFKFGFGIQVGAENEKEMPNVKIQFVVIRNNVIFNNLITGIGIGHEPDKEKMKSYVWNCNVVNNTLYGNGTKTYSGAWSKGELHFGSYYKDTLKNIIIKDNIIFARMNQHLVRAEGNNLSPDVEFSGNLFWAENSKNLWAWKEAGYYYQQSDIFDNKGISQLNKLQIKGDNNFWINPQFILQYPSKREDFQLKENNPAKGKGNLIF